MTHFDPFANITLKIGPKGCDEGTKEFSQTAVDFSDVEGRLQQESQDQIETGLDEFAEHWTTRFRRQCQRVQSPRLKRANSELNT